MSKKTSRKLLYVEDVAHEFGIAPSTLRYWRYGGIGPKSARLGRHVVYRPDDVDAWIASAFAAEDGK